MITYNDFIGTMLSLVTSVVNIISYVLNAFVSVSLIVSSIAIGIITYISVLERTKERLHFTPIGAIVRRYYVGQCRNIYGWIDQWCIRHINYTCIECSN